MSAHAGTIGAQRIGGVNRSWRMLLVLAVMVAAVAAGLTALWAHGSSPAIQRPVPALSHLEPGHSGGPSIIRNHGTGVSFHTGRVPPHSPAGVHGRQIVP
jgi:hypothetical protein